MRSKSKHLEQKATPFALFMLVTSARYLSENAIALTFATFVIAFKLRNSWPILIKFGVSAVRCL